VFSLTASIGVVCAPQDGGDVATLLKHADAAMYRAKQRGRAAFQFYSGDIGAGAVEVLQLTSSLEHAVARGELSLVYQPRVRLHDATLSGVEALLRWQHPELGAIPPARFIPLAEETGQIVEIGRWVLRRACEQAMAWRGAGLPPFAMSVNLSTRQLIDTDFVDAVRAVLRETGFPPEDLEFEITEGTTVHDYPVVNAMLAALAGMGVAISVDDFGTGYSSLQQLYRLSIDRLKIDRSFVEALPDDDSAHAIVAAIVAMARALRLATTAEGVETEAQLRCLQELGCDEVQGYLLAMPLTPNGLAEAIHSDAGILRLRAGMLEPAAGSLQ
jgi:EAL domain-containing protein (putative c-di-GMP-specific phosphodiesterase class I)